LLQKILELAKSTSNHNHESLQVVAKKLKIHYSLYIEIFHIFESYHVTLKSRACKLFAKACRFIMGQLNDKFVGFSILVVGEIYHNQQLQVHTNSQEHQDQMCLEHSFEGNISSSMVTD
jgi:hypothetical protein